MKKFIRVHLVGILGSGMSGIAEHLHQCGYVVTGSDIAMNDTYDKLVELGINITIGHSANNVINADAVVFSNAVKRNNIELQTAIDKKIPIIPRAEMLAEISRSKFTIAISGTHGKTTTTSITGEVVSSIGANPTVIVGGRLKKLGSSVVYGESDVMVLEADEFEKSFLKLTPTYAIITNVDSDHLECYGNLNELWNAFVQFGNSVPFYGKTIVCIDDAPIRELMPRFNRSVLTYGFSESADVRADNAVYSEFQTTFDLYYKGSSLGEVKISLPGKHNVLNSLAAISVGLELGGKFEDITAPLVEFTGVQRRFEYIGEFNNVVLIDDFAHHPAEIQASINAAKSGWNRRIIAIFQPHLFSRTLELYERFGQSFSEADFVMLLPIYPAREEPIEGVSNELIFNAAVKNGQQNIELVEDKSRITEQLSKHLRDNDMVMVLGAGDVYKIIPQIRNLLEERKML